MRRKGRHFGLGTKMNALLIAGILLISVGLLAITYEVYCRKVNSVYWEEAQRAAREVVKEYVIPYYVKDLRQKIDTDEFRQVRRRAEAAQDASIIEDWMRRQLPAWYETYDLVPDSGVEQRAYMPNLLQEYQSLVDDLNRARSVMDITSVYVQYVVDGVTYQLADPDESLLILGTAEEPLEAFARYRGNDRIPPTIYAYRGGWLCTACEPYVDGWGDDTAVVAQVGVDIDMSQVMRERHWFLLNSVVFVALSTLAAMLVSLLLVRRLATKPLKLLAEGTTGFASDDGSLSTQDVIDLPIRSEDEIGELYHEIRAMQGRIVKSAEGLAKITAERERVNTELGMAAQIQASVLPRRFPAFPDRTEFDLYASMDPAKEVGGDFYDFFMVDDDHLALVIADVADKGVPAALFMMSARTILRYRARMGGGPGEILASVNAQLCKDNAMKMFVTVWLGVLEISTGLLACANAGHEYPFIRTGGAFRLLRDRHGIMVGVMQKARFPEYTLALSPGDAVFVYTDGVPEANNAADEMYGMDRLAAVLNRAPGDSPEGILKAVRADVDAFVDGARQFDDLTMLGLVYRGLPSAEGGTR